MWNLNDSIKQFHHIRHKNVHDNPKQAANLIEINLCQDIIGIIYQRNGSYNLELTEETYFKCLCYPVWWVGNGAIIIWVVCFAAFDGKTLRS